MPKKKKDLGDPGNVVSHADCEVASAICRFIDHNCVGWYDAWSIERTLSQKAEYQVLVASLSLFSNIA
jgi:hypothetical protein